MAKGTLGQVIQRAISDAAFRNRLRTDPGGALSGFDLTPDERAALRSGDAAKLASFGVDQRMSKAFAMGEAASSFSRLGTDYDLTVGSTVPDGGQPLVEDAILGDTSGAARNAFITGNAGGQSRLDEQQDGVGRSALDDQQSGVRSAADDNATAGGRSAVDSGSTSSWKSAPIDGGTETESATLAASDSNATSAFITSDETGSDAVASGALAASDSNATDAFLTADEMGNNVVASGATPGWSAAPIEGGVEGEALDAGTSMANPQGYDHPDPIA